MEPELKEEHDVASRRPRHAFARSRTSSPPVLMGKCQRIEASDISLT